jgi:3-oxoacyl-[acyl-carrier protein] reductase
MVELFAALTGDRSSLHVDDNMARRSAYRRRVVHGMLPVAFLAMLRRVHGKRLPCTVVGLAGRFLAPVHVDDTLTLIAQPGQPAATEGEVEFGFQIVNEASKVSVTRGSATLRFAPAPAESPAAAASRNGMLVEPITMQNVMLEQIERGARDAFQFQVSSQSVQALADLLASGLMRDAVARPVDGNSFWTPNLLAALLLSTSVGVSMPGASATFLEFTFRAEHPIALNAVHALEGEVVHRSVSTRIVKKQIVIRRLPDGAVVARGKVATLVNTPSRKMPTIDELKQSATDWGIAGKVVLVTGASRGIGETIAKLFALHGARVVVNYHRGADDAARVVEEIVTAGGDAMAIAADVSDAEAVQRLVQGAVSRFGTVHVLVNSAVRDFRPIPFAQLTWEEIQKDVDVVAKGAFLCCQHVLPLMLAQGSGKIINISTVAVDNPPPDQTKYVLAKSALVGLTRSLSIEYAARNIQVNMVVPNFVETDLVAHVQEGFRRRIAQDTPMGRHASPVEVAQAVVFLASNFSAFTTGQKVMVTGGGAPYG